MSADRGSLLQGASSVKKSVDPLTADLTPSSIPNGRYAAWLSSTEAALGEVLAELLHLDSVSALSNFFEDLGADSMVMAQFCARVRKRPELPSVSMKDIYQHPTIRRLAAALEEVTAPPTERGLADVLADVMRIDRVSPDSNFFDDLGADSMVMAQFCARVRKHEDLPSVSMKDIYQHPTIRTLTAALTATGPAALEKALAEVLADVMRIDRVSPDSNFFDDLGADSMVMAQFCARVRQHQDLPSVSMKDIYRHPTIGSLARVLGGTAPAAVEQPAPAPETEVTPTSTREYVLCGALQLLIFLGYLYCTAWVGAAGFNWIAAGTGVVGLYLRSVVFGSALFFGLCTLPILAKWVLIGRWRPQQIRIWSLGYVRFWLAKTLVRSNPLVLFFSGSPVYPLYLRALGAHVGRGVTILSRSVPVCTDMVTIGDGSVIRKDTFFPTYRARAGVIETGGVSLGRNTVVGEASVLDIDTSMGDGAQLGHRSSLHAGQSVPAGEHWHGSPARQTDVDFQHVPPADSGSLRKVSHSLQQLATVVFLYMPLAVGALALILGTVPTGLPNLTSAPVTSGTFYRDVLVISIVFFFGPVLLSPLVVFLLARVFAMAIKPGKVYPLYGFHYSVQRTITRLTNVKFLLTLAGDSSYIVHYLRWLGWDLSKVEQTGSNFGTGVKQDTPYLCKVGTGTMVADGLSMMNAEFSSTSFRLSPVSIGPRNFLGNTVHYPPGGKTGDNVLLATKVMVPIDGEVREGVGLLGSPAFEIPRSVNRDSSIADMRTEEQLTRLLAAKNRYNVRTVGVLLFARWLNFFLVTLVALTVGNLYETRGAAAMAAGELLLIVVTTAYGLVVERATARFGRLSPQLCSIYTPYFWWHERYWKMLAHPHYVNGTPFKGLIWRLSGVRVGRRLFDDGCGIPERTLVTIGDDCTLNAGSEIQGHSQEDGAFKSDYITLGRGCTIGVGSLIHYGVTIGDGAVLGPDSFLMKGEEIPPYARWSGNPALPSLTDVSSPARAASLRANTRGRHRAERAPRADSRGSATTPAALPVSAVSGAAADRDVVTVSRGGAA
jgi:non-ribosomal peptide synthetase-like protein